MNQILLTLSIGYVLMSIYFFCNWLKFSRRYPSSSPENSFLSFVVFLITTVFWPLSIPMCLLEIFNTRKLHFSTVVSVMVTLFAYSLSVYSNVK